MGSLSKQRIVYNSTFNIRAAYVKFFTLLSMIATYFCDFEDNYGTFAIWDGSTPDGHHYLVVSIIVVRAMSWRVIVTQLLSIYIGTVDIFYEQFRVVVGSWETTHVRRGGQRMNLWATRPWAASKPSVCAVAWNSSSRRQYSASFYGR
jgi:hypothetical protein